jgi:hypothetical protein
MSIVDMCDKTDEFIRRKRKSRAFISRTDNILIETNRETKTTMKEKLKDWKKKRKERIVKVIFYAAGSPITLLDVFQRTLSLRKEMHRCRASFPSVYQSHTCHPASRFRHPHGIHHCSSYAYPQELPAPDFQCCASNYAYDYPCEPPMTCLDYPCYDYVPYLPVRQPFIPPPPIIQRPPIVQTNIHNDVVYYMDEPNDDIYDDVYGHPYRLSKSKVQLVDIAAKNRSERHENPMVVSTFQPRQRQAGEHVIVPRSTVVRHTSVPPYERTKRVKLMPLHRSAERRPVPSRHRRSVGQELIPLATVARSHPKQQTIRVRSLSPLV